MHRAPRAVAVLFAGLALPALSGCELGFDVTPLAPDAGTPSRVASGLSLGPVVEVATLPGREIVTPDIIASNGSEWLLVSAEGNVQTLAVGGSLGPVWSLSEPPSDLAPGSISVAGTTGGYVFVHNSIADGSLRLVRALGDGTILERAAISDAAIYPSRAVVAGAGDAAWVAIESCVLPGSCTVRAYRASIDARGDRAMDTLCDDCFAPGATVVPAGSPHEIVLAGDADGAVLGWGNALSLQFRSLRFDAGTAVLGPVSARALETPASAPFSTAYGYLAAAAHGGEVSIAWRDGPDLLRERIDTRTGELITMAPQRFGVRTIAPGTPSIRLVAIGDDVLVMPECFLVRPEPEPVPWELPCYPASRIRAGAAGPPGHALIASRGDGSVVLPRLFDVSHAGAVDVSPWSPAPTDAPLGVALGCDPSGCSLAAGSSLAPLAGLSFARGTDLELGLGDISWLRRTGGIAYAGVPTGIARIDATGATVSGTVDVRPLATASGREPGTLLFADAPASELRVSRWSGAVVTPLSTLALDAVAGPPSSIALASSAAGLAVAWIDRRDRRVAFSSASDEGAPLSLPLALAEGDSLKRGPTVAIVDTTALVAWDEASSWDAYELRVAVIDLARGDIIAIESPLGELAALGNCPELVTTGEVALLAWRNRYDGLRLARLDATGRPLDPTGSSALVVGSCAGIAAIDARRAAVLCVDEGLATGGGRSVRRISARMVFLPEGLR